MAFSEEQMKKQIDDFAELTEEFSRLQSLEEQLFELWKKGGLPDPRTEELDADNFSSELKKLVAESQEQACRAGAARAAQYQSANAPASSARPGAGRRGVVRM